MSTLFFIVGRQLKRRKFMFWRVGKKKEIAWFSTCYEFSTYFYHNFNFQNLANRMNELRMTRSWQGNRRGFGILWIIHPTMAEFPRNTYLPCKGVVFSTVVSIAPWIASRVMFIIDDTNPRIQYSGPCLQTFLFLSTVCPVTYFTDLLSSLSLYRRCQDRQPLFTGQAWHQMLLGPKVQPGSVLSTILASVGLFPKTTGSFVTVGRVGFKMDPICSPWKQTFRISMLFGSIGFNMLHLPASH